MERLQAVKALLKRWEAAFAQQHGRRPGTGDVEAAPEDVRRLYREYRALKHRGELAPCPPAEGSPATEQDSGCWGTHLNRQPKAPKSSATNQPVPAASAQHFGRKLKANLGAAIKERPPVPRRTLAPRPKPVPQQEHGATSPVPSPPGDADGSEPPELLLPAAVRALAPLVLTEGPRPRPQGNKFQRLRQTVARRLSSLDAAWLRRCQGEPGPEEPPDWGAEPRGAEPQGVEGENVAPAGIRSPPQEPEVSEGARGELAETEGGERPAGHGGDSAAGPRGADGGRAPEELPGGTGGAKKVGGKRRRRDSGAGGSEQPARKQPREKAPAAAPPAPENLLGDIEEEKLRPPCRAAPARAPRRPPGNFVRLNLKNRSHVRGHVLRGNRLREQVWKQKWQKKAAQFGGGSALGGSSGVCFCCGATGHWAAECRGEAGRAREEEEEEEEEEDPLPTLAEVARRTNSVCPELSESGGPEGAAGEVTAHLEVQRAPYEPPEPPAPVEPLYSLGPGGKVRETPAEVLEALEELGFSSFRPGQEAAVMRILSGLSTLVVLPTGLGKSLCYQLPAYLYRKRSPCVALVVSPLVALMDDQVSGLPRGLRAVCVHSNMSRAQREAAVEQVRKGAVHALLLSPEALVGGGGSGSCCLPPAAELPPVAFACIDEAHCVSQWSHNFRPSYLRLCKVLRDRLGVRCFLGLTATATPATARDVAAHLGVAEEEGEEGIAGRCAAVPPNLRLSVSMDRDRDQALISLLRGERFGHLDSIIVYCTRREETARVAALIRTCLQGVLPAEPPAAPQDDGDAGRKKERAKSTRRPLKWIADAYHAGLSAAERRRVQRSFMSGQLRVVVATVAFGMGLDKADVRGVVHYNMPKNFESYVQEIGRAGRDGEPARCHLFLDPEGEDLHELRRHIYGDTVDFFTVKKLVQKVFSRCKCRELHQKRQALGGDAEADDAAVAELAEEPEGGAARGSEQPRRACYMHERAVPVQRTVEELDVREEGIETLLCYLELHPRRWLELLPPTYSSCRVQCYGGPQQLRAAARSCPPIAVFLARERLAGRPHARDSSVEFDVVSLSDSMGWEVPLVKRALRQLQWDTQLRRGGRAGAGSGVLVEFAELSFHLRAYGDLSEQELDSVCDFLHRRVVARERAALGQLRACFRAFKSVAFQSCEPHPEQAEEERSSRLRALLRDYFEKEAPGEPAPRGCEEEEEEEDEEEDRRGAQDGEDQVRADVRHFLAIRQDEKFSGRAVARIFHGIGSPCYPAQVYGRDRRFWRKHLRFDFHRIMRVATEEILALR
ncbi:ATP-dependent DNA helicase Q4 [Cygnus atratus]|uniref:ATP-dependent DNA helicase Q4 n=1 Tax=Cygnus atratus TaxID=8868 RepID=UPI0015D659EE|nr:ATP-dependent DNA helicase Q4 [Cygnus atratus]